VLLNSTMRSLVFWMAMAVIAVMVWNFSTKFQASAKSLTFTEFMMAVDTSHFSYCSPAAVRGPGESVART
jgi:hypothetical protein